MPEIYLKKANKTPETGTSETRKIVERMLSEIENGKDQIWKEKHKIEKQNKNGQRENDTSQRKGKQRSVRNG